MKTLTIITDAWTPQVNGVVTTLLKTVEMLRKDLIVNVIEPSMSNWRVPTPGYPEIKLPLTSASKIEKILTSQNPDYIHIAVEGRLGLAARQACSRMGIKFTTAYHTKFPEYFEDKFRVPTSLTYRYLKWFHSASSKVFVATESLENDLRTKGFDCEFHRWSRGVDVEVFSPSKSKRSTDEKYALYIGRVSSEKNIEEFLRADIPIKKVVIGDGPQRLEYKNAFLDVDFPGAMDKENLAKYYAGAQVFAFPSKNDTFGLVVLEALASGTPVVAFDVPGPGDIFAGKNKAELILKGIGAKCGSSREFAEVLKYYSKVNKNRIAPRDFVLNEFSWEKATEQFLNGLILAK